MARKIAICGTSLTTRHLAPWDQMDYELWTLGKNYKHPRQGKLRHYELHGLTDGYNRWSPEYCKWLSGGTHETWIQKTDSRIPNGKIFPLDAILDHFPRRYLTCQIAQILAHAIYEHQVRGKKIESIGIYGCDLAQDSAIREKCEYTWQRPSVEYFCGYIDAMPDVELHIPRQSDICKSGFVYAYEDEAMSALRAMSNQRDEELAQRMQNIEQDMQRLSYTKGILAGAQENMRWMKHFLPAPYEVDQDSELADEYQRQRNGNNGNGSAVAGTVDSTRREAALATE
jgi:hypothetical protein